MNSMIRMSGFFNIGDQCLILQVQLPILLKVVVLFIKVRSFLIFDYIKVLPADFSSRLCVCKCCSFLRRDRCISRLSHWRMVWDFNYFLSRQVYLFRWEMKFKIIPIVTVLTLVVVLVVVVVLLILITVVISLFFVMLFGWGVIVLCQFYLMLTQF